MSRVVYYPLPKELNFLICWLSMDDEPISVEPREIFHVHHGPQHMRLLVAKRFDDSPLTYSQKADFWSWLALVNWHDARQLLEG
jgi:hypothetical protein